MALGLDSIAKVENELEAVRDQIEEVRDIPNISIGSLQTNDADNFKRLLGQERKLERQHAQLGGTSISTQNRRSTGGTGGTFY